MEQHSRMLYKSLSSSQDEYQPPVQFDENHERAFVVKDGARREAQGAGPRA